MEPIRMKGCEATLSMGQQTLAVPLSLFSENRTGLCTALLAHPSLPSDSWVLLQGGDSLPLYDTDVEYVFRQESYFMWTWGVLEPGCMGLLHVPSGRSVLLVPHLPQEYAVWMGPLLEKEDFRRKYCVDLVLFTNEINDFLSKENPGALLTLKGVNSDSKLSAKEATFKGIENFNVNNEILFPVIAERRVFKTNAELQVLRYAVEVSSAAHRRVMRTPLVGSSEYQCESVFLDYAYRVGGCRHVSYACICGTGPNAAVLHYGHAGAPNDRLITERDMCLFDMGANYMGYAADITCSYPASGRFTADQRLVYEAVLAANEAVKAAAGPGASWVDMHRLANERMLTALKEGGLVRGDVQRMLDAGLAAVFQPHGLGHLMGLDVHDVGGYLSGHPTRPAQPGLCRLRTARVLKPRMVLTIEPGCYFIKPLLDNAMKDPKLRDFLVPEALDRFKDFGGVRIEDDVVITETGIEDLTKVPRTVEEIERWMAGQDDDKYGNN